MAIDNKLLGTVQTAREIVENISQPALTGYFTEPTWLSESRKLLEQIRPKHLVEMEEMVARYVPYTEELTSMTAWVQEAQKMNEFYSSVQISNTLAEAISAPVNRLFVEDHWNSILNIDYEISKTLKTNRFINEYWAQQHNIVNVSYDFSKVEDKEDIRTGEIITPQLIISEAKSMGKIIAEIYKDNRRLLQVTPREFEELIAELLIKKGYQVDLTKQTRDGGYDLLALSFDNGMPLKYLVECKRNARNRPVGISVVRSFCDTIHEQKANKGIIVTTSTFSTDARMRQKANPYILDFKDHDDVITWVRDYMLTR